jgi:hypothetical protein
MIPMTSRLRLAVLCFLLAGSRVASDERALVHEGYLKAEKYLEFEPREQAIYAMGLVDGMYLAPVFDAPNDSKYLSSLQTCLKEMSNTQVAAIITKFAKEHPEKWHMGTNVLAYQALRQDGVCPVPAPAQ